MEDFLKPFYESWGDEFFQLSLLLFFKGLRNSINNYFNGAKSFFWEFRLFKILVFLFLNFKNRFFRAELLKNFEQILWKLKQALLDFTFYLNFFLFKVDTDR